MSLETFLSLILTPDAPPPGERFLPRDDSADKYVIPGDVSGAAELLSGSLISLPGKECLEGVDLSDLDAVQSELGKAWVGGYVTGREWAMQNMMSLLMVYLERLDDPMIRSLAAYDWDEDASQPEVLEWFSQVATAMNCARSMEDVAAKSTTSAT